MDSEIKISEDESFLGNSKSDSFQDKNEDTRSELNFERDVETNEEKVKRKQIESALDENTKHETWIAFAISKFGLVGDDLRCRIWPLLLQVDPSTDEKIPSLSELSTHPEYQQVVLDVNRSLKRFPPGIPYKQRVALQDQLTVLILRVIMRYPELRYYQGYHDVAITFLLVVGEAVAFRIMEKLSNKNLREFMEPTMEKTNYTLNYIYALLYRVDRELHDFMDRACVGTIFALPWFLTWFGHSLDQYKDVVRLYDYFLATPPFMPLYVTTALVISRRNEVFAEGYDMASIHCLLSKIPKNVDFETILVSASKYYKDYPPSKLEHLVKKRIAREMAERKRQDQLLKKLRGQTGFWTRFNIPSWLIFNRRNKFGLVFAVATVLISYAYYYRFGSEVRFPFFGLNDSKKQLTGE